MPYTIAGVHKVSDHRVMSPVQADGKTIDRELYDKAKDPYGLQEKFF